MNNKIKNRIQNMYLRDCIMAWADVLLIWLAVGFVLISILSILEDPVIRWVMIISSALLVLFNTASVGAMTKHYAEDKDYIYGLDIKHLDDARGHATHLHRQAGAGFACVPCRLQPGADSADQRRRLNAAGGRFYFLTTISQWPEANRIQRLASCRRSLDSQFLPSWVWPHTWLVN